MNPHEVAFRNTATQQHKLPLNAFTEHAEGQLQIAQKIASLGNKFANAMQEIGQATYSIKESINADKYGYEYEAIPGEGYQEFLKRKESLASSQFFSQQQQFINDQTNALRNSVLNGEIKTSKQFDDTLVGLEKAALENAQKIIENSEPITKERLAKKLEVASKAMFAENGIKARQEYFQIAKDIRQKQYITNAQDCALIGDIEGVQAQMTNAIQDGGNIAEISPLFRSLSCQATIKQYEIDTANRTHDSVAFRTNLLEIRQKGMTNCLKNAFTKGIYDADSERINKGFDKIDKEAIEKNEKQIAENNIKSKNAFAKFQKAAKKSILLGDFGSLDNAFFDALADGSNPDDALELKNNTTAEMIVSTVGQVEYYKAFGTNTEIEKAHQKALLENIGAPNGDYQTELNAKIKELPIELQKDVEIKIADIKEKIKAGVIQNNAFNSAEFAKAYSRKNILQIGNDKITTTQEARIKWKSALNFHANENLKKVWGNFKKTGAKVEIEFHEDFEQNINAFKNATENNEYFHALALGLEQAYYANSQNIDDEIAKNEEAILKQGKEVVESMFATALTQNDPVKFIDQNIERETTYSIAGVAPSQVNNKDSLFTLINIITNIEDNASADKLGGACVKLRRNCTPQDFKTGLAFLAGNKMEGTLPAQEKKEMANAILKELGYSDSQTFAVKMASMPTIETEKIAQCLQSLGALPPEIARKTYGQIYTEIKQLETREGKNYFIATYTNNFLQKIESMELETAKARAENQRQAKLSKAVVEANANELKQEVEESTALQKAKQFEEQQKKKSNQKPNTDWRMVQL